MIVRFDDSLVLLAEVVKDELSEIALSSGVVLRDTTGRLAFFSASNLGAEKVAALTEKLQNKLGYYARTDRAVADLSAYGVAEILEDQSIVTIHVGDYKIRLIDRRLAGADWLRAPVRQAPPPPRFVFSSIKGGVGRSTALAIVAADLASRGLKILAVDLDIEAPGLGSILLDDDALPEFGLLDALVENGFAPFDETFLADLISPSKLAGHRGRIDVMPVLGRRSLSNPAEVLAKIARAYAENIDDNGNVATVLDQVSSLIDKFSDHRRYDAILVDARAGLHETSASAILGLGAEVFLFGLDEPQTYHGFKILLSHMALFKVDNQFPEWLSRLTIVQGKAPAEASSRQAFSEKCRDLLIEVGLGPQAAASEVEVLPTNNAFNVTWDDDIKDEEVLPSEELLYLESIAIIDDARYKSFNPLVKRDLIENGIYSSSFRQILDKINSSLPANQD